ncbi:MAG: hypothetical protein AAF617_02380 [Bacteroidota bacterium]
MKNFLKLSMILALVLCTFSCSNDNTDVIPEDPQSNTEAKVTIKSNMTDYARSAASTGQAEAIFENNNDNNNILEDCFTLNFPFSVSNGNEVVSITNQQDSDTYEALGYYLVFPVDVTLSDGTVQTINNELEIITLLEACFQDASGTGNVGNPPGGGNSGDDPFLNDCFEFNFPLSVATIDGSTVVVNDEYELFTVQDAVGFVYPITVTAQTATGAAVVTINSDEDFDALYNDCFDIEPCTDCVVNCFEIVFPLTLVDDSGNVTTVNNDTEFITFLDGLANDAFFTITFPMTIEYTDGTQATINSEDELIAAFDACDD